MLIDFKVKNYRSIKDEQDLSMLSTKQKEHIDTHTFKSDSATKINLLKTAAIYGANISEIKVKTKRKNAYIKIDLPDDFAEELIKQLTLGKQTPFKGLELSWYDERLDDV